MFRRVAEIAYTNMPGTEGNDVKSFLKNSNEMKEMRKISLANPSNRSYLETINKLDTALTFNQILDATSRINDIITNDPSVQSLGRNGVNAILFFAGFVNSEANFGYYMLHLRENALDVMARKDYQSNSSNQVGEAIRQIK